MNEFKHAREEYESTPIPEELNERVQAGIRQGRSAGRTKRHGFRWGVGVAAACMVMVGGLNVSPTFAAAAGDVPVLGGLFQILTVRSYNEEDGQVNQHVSVPEVDAEGDLAQQVNAEIQERWMPTWPRPSRSGRTIMMPSSPPAARRRNGASVR